jgi:hypothetical protein
MVTEEMAQVRAEIPRALKRKAFAVFALRDIYFNRWLQHQLEAFVQESSELAAQRRDPAHLDEDVVAVTR